MCNFHKHGPHYKGIDGIVVVVLICYDKVGIHQPLTNHRGCLACLTFRLICRTWTIFHLKKLSRLLTNHIVVIDGVGKLPLSSIIILLGTCKLQPAYMISWIGKSQPHAIGFTCYHGISRWTDQRIISNKLHLQVVLIKKYLQPYIIPGFWSL